VAITTHWRNTGVRGSVSAPDFHDWHDTASSFDAMAYYSGGETSVAVGGASDYATAIRVTPGFFAVFGVPPERGRVLETTDEPPGSSLAAVIGHEFWMRRFGGDVSATAPAVIARTAGDPMSVASAFADTIRTANPNVPVRATTMTQVLSTAVATPRFRTLLVGVFAALALVLAMAGVYGVMAYAVSRRTSEIGVRIAMGANRPAILRLVMGQGLQLAALGIVIGCALALALSQALRGMLFAIAPTDPLVFVVVPILLLATAAAATAVPALRASRIDPIQALRSE